MTKKKSQVFDTAPDLNLGAYRRNQWFEYTKTGIQIFLMAVGALAITGFTVLIILAGVTRNFLPNTDGTQALTKLFIEVTENAKAVGLFALGFFFREYLNAKNIKT